MLITALDLEMAQPSENIIQIGAVVGDLRTGEILEEFNRIIRLPKGEQLTEYIIKLTGITQVEVDNGVSLVEGYQDLKALHLKYKSSLNPLTWGGADTTTLRQQLGEMTEGWCFGRRWIDVKTVYQSYRIANNQKHQSGLAKSLLKLGMQFNGAKHNATDDARNTFLIYCKLLNLLKDKQGE